jgi:hypothetical protein
MPQQRKPSILPRASTNAVHDQMLDKVPQQEKT